MATLLLICGLSLIGVLFAVVFDRVDLANVTCNCGRRIAVDLVIVDATDATRYRELLSENCPVCQERRRAARADRKSKARHQKSAVQGGSLDVNV